MTALASSPLSTLSYAAIITWKQVEILLFLLDMDETSAAPRTTREISDFLTEIRDERIAFNEHIYYCGTSYSSIYGCLKTLESRGLVQRRNYDDRWWITEKGMRAYDGSLR